MIEMVAPVVLVGLIGLCLGSFATTAALRLCRFDQVVLGRSHCDHCAVTLSYSQTVPVLSYLRQVGACGACGGAIDPLHPVGEVLGATVVVAAYLTAPAPRAVLISGLGLVLLASSVVDAKTRRLPDRLTLVVAILALALDAITSLTALAGGLIAAVLVFVIFEAVRRGYLRLRGRPGMGFGDVKLAAALALWLGLATPWAIMLAAGLGLIAMIILRPADGRLAFGPSLAAAGWLVGLMGEAHRWPALI